MNEKPSYLGLLNAIAVGEARGHAVLSAWRDATDQPALAEVLNVVAIREQEHAAAFTKRLCELGFAVREKPSSEFEQNLQLARSDASDVDKFRQILGYRPDEDAGSGADADALSSVFSDRTIDPETGALLGRFVAEERDSERRLRGALAGLGSGPAEDPVLKDIAARLDRLTTTLEELRKLRA